MFAPQDGTTAVIYNGMVDITYYPRNITVYAGFHYGLITDEDLTLDVEFNENGAFVFSVSAEMCGKGIPIAPVKNSDGTTTSDQYYLCIPAREKLPEGGSGDLLFSVNEFGQVIWSTNEVASCRVGVLEDEPETWFNYDFSGSEVNEIFLQRIINELYAEGNIRSVSDYTLRFTAWNESGDVLIDQYYNFKFSPQEFDNNEQADLNMAVGDTVYVNLLCNDTTLPYGPDVDVLGDCVIVNQVQGADEQPVGNTRMFSITASKTGDTTVIFHNKGTGSIYATYYVHVTEGSGDISGDPGYDPGDVSGDASGDAGSVRLRTYRRRR